jgi:hypothetical protein
MCDYSLMMVRSRLAVEGEELVAHRFQSGSVGLVSCADFNSWINERPIGFWQRLKCWFSSDKEPAPVACIPPGAQLLVAGISRSLQKQFNLRECEEATFTETSAEPGWHRDALCFENGSILRLGLLPEGQRLRVLRLSSQESVEPLSRGSRPEGVLQEV